MARKLIDNNGSGPLSPLIDVVMNGLAAVFIILMIYLMFARPTQVETLKFLGEVKPPTASSGQNYVFTFPVTGGAGERKFGLIEGNLPDGLMFADNSGTIYGTPTPVIGNNNQSFPLRVEVKDATGLDVREATLELALGATPYSTQLAITSTVKTLQLARIGVKYEEVLGATGGVEPYKWMWRIVSGKIPNGLQLQQNNGRIFGTPKGAGVFSFEVTVSNPPGSFNYKGVPYSWPVEKDQKTYQINVLDKIISSINLPVGRVGEPYVDAVVKFSGDNYLLPGEQVTWTIPEESGLRGTTKGKLHGTPSSAGNFEISYQILDHQGQQIDHGTGKIKVLEKLISSLELPAGRVDVPYMGAVMLSKGGYLLPEERVVWTHTLQKLGLKGTHDGKLYGTPSSPIKKGIEISYQIINSNNKKLDDGKSKLFIFSRDYSLVEELTALKTENQELRNQLAEKKQDKKDRVIILSKVGGFEPFKKGSAILTERAKYNLRGQLNKITDYIKAREANQINVIGYASPEPHKGSSDRDENLNLSVERAVSVAHFLKQQGVPYESMPLS